jgi:nucleotide-binding universal stress UspA family protein
MRRILVGLDGSALAETILGAVRTLAERLRAEIVLLHVTVVPETARAAADDAETGLDDLVTQERRRADRYLEEVALKLRAAGGAVRTATVVGEPAPEIVRFAEREKVDLIALATHGRSGLGRWLHGSVADAVLHAATTPLLLLRPAADEGAAPMVTRVVVPLDGSPLAEAALATAAPLARALGVPLLLLRIVEYTGLAFAADPLGAVPLAYAPVLEALREGATRYLESRADELRAQGPAVEIRVLDGMAADAITGEIRALPGSLLVLSTHGRTGWRAVALGSVARRVVLVAAAPVLVVRSAPSSLAP